MEHILSLSYGKDSLACLGAIEELGWPLDRFVHAEVWATDTITPNTGHCSSNGTWTVPFPSTPTATPSTTLIADSPLKTWASSTPYIHSAGLCWTGMCNYDFKETP